MKKISLKTLLPIFIITIIAAPTTVILPWLGYVTYDFLKTDALAHQTMVNQHLARNVEVEIKRLATLLNGEANALSLTTQGQLVISDVDKLLHRTVAEEVAIESLYLVDSDNRIIATAKYNLDPTNTTHKTSNSGDTLDPAALKGLSPFLNQVMISPVSTQNEQGIFSLVSPVTVDHTTPGLLIACINTNRLWQTINRNVDRTDYRHFLTDDRGLLRNTMKAANIADRSGWQVVNAAPVTPPPSGHARGEMYLGIDSVPVYGVRTLINGTNMAIMSELPVESVVGPMRSVLAVLFIVLALTALAVISIGIVFVQRLTSPLYELGSAFGELSTGTETPKVSRSWLKEIDSLVVAFYDMLDRTSSAESRFERVFENADVAMQIYSSDGTLIIANQASCKLWGATSKRHASHYNLLQDESVMRCFGDRICQAFSGNVVDLPPYPIELRVGRHSEETHDAAVANTRLVPVQDNQKRVSHVIIIHNDITDIYQAQQVLVEQETRFTTIINQSATVIYVKDLEGRYTLVNQHFARIIGLDVADILGKTAFDMMTESDAVQHTKNDAQVLHSRQAMEFRETNTVGNHTYHFLSVKFCLFDESNEPYAICGVSSDIQQIVEAETALKKNQQLLEAILENSSSLIFVKDLNGRFIHVNSRYAALFNKSPGELLGETVYSLFPQDVADRYTARDHQLISHGQALEYEETAEIKGESRTYWTTKFLLKDEQQKVFAFACISTDITLNKQQEEQLRSSQKMEALGKLTGGIAHDYNNSLGIISGFAEMLQNQSLDQSEIDLYATKILLAAQHGANLSKKLLAFTRHTPSVAQVVDISEFIQENRAILEKALTAPRIELELILAAELWQISVDRGDLGDAILNLSINAMHAMPDGGKLTIETRNVVLDATTAQKLNLPSGEFVSVSATDTGTGMTKDVLPKIFDPFFTTKGSQGTGLGLSQVYGLVRRSGGTIDVQSSPGYGSRFLLYFPRTSGTPVEKERIRPADPIVTENGSAELILIVDDEPDMQELARLILATRGYETLTASNGEEALAVLAEQPVQLLISDIIMPVMDGFKLAETVAEQYPETKILLVSGFGIDELEHSATIQALQANMIVKPYRSAHLLNSVRTLLGQ